MPTPIYTILLDSYTMYDVDLMVNLILKASQITPCRNLMTARENTISIYYEPCLLCGYL